MDASHPSVEKIREFNRFYTNVIGVLDQHILDSPYSLSEARVLFEIAHGHNCTARRIMSAIDIDEGYLSRILDRFVKRNILRKDRSSIDRRAFHLNLTVKGKKEMSKLEQSSKHEISRIIEDIPDVQVDHLLNHMNSIRKTLSGERMGISLEDISIRTDVQSGDIGYTAFMHGDLYQREYNYGITFEKYVTQGLFEFYHLYNPQRNRVWVCEHQGQIVGTLFLMQRGDSAQLRYFLIDPSYRGLGLGKKLMHLYMEFLRQCNYQHSYLWTTHELQAAASLYQRKEFVLTEEIKSNSFGKELVEQRYDWKEKVG